MRGMNPATCFYCKREREFTSGAGRLSSKASRSGDPYQSDSEERTHAVYSRQADSGQIVVRLRANHPSLKYLDYRITHVHISGSPTLEGLHHILAHAPNVLVIRMVKTARHRFTAEMERLCQERKIAIECGYVAPWNSWEGQNRSRTYALHRNMLLGDGEHKRRLDELLTYGVTEARVAARYYCLAGEPYVSTRTLAVKLGMNEQQRGLVHLMIKMTLCYLFPALARNKNVGKGVRSIERRIAQLRNAQANITGECGTLMETP